MESKLAQLVLEINKLQTQIKKSSGKPLRKVFFWALWFKIVISYLNNVIKMLMTP